MIVIYQPAKTMYSGWLIIYHKFSIGHGPMSLFPYIINKMSLHPQVGVGTTGLTSHTTKNIVRSTNDTPEEIKV
jgi:hypothetical protein